MNILILHRIPYYKIDYHLGINHEVHEVTYIGTKESLDNIPQNLKCQKVVRPGVNEIVEEVYTYIKNTNRYFDHIISLSEYELMAAAKLRSLCGLNGSNPDQVKLVRDKVLMKQALPLNIKSPEFMPLSEIFKENSLPKNVAVVLKPVDGASSENIIICSNIEEVKTRLRNKSTGISALDNQEKPLIDFEVEEYIEGDILHIDGIVNHGQILLCQASQYVGNCLAYAYGAPLASIQIETTTAIKEWAQACVNATRIIKGSFHLEAINTPDGLVFLEIANRVGGADVVKTFELATGIHLPSVELKLILGEQIDFSNRNLNQYQYHYGWFAYPGHTIPSGYAKILNTSKFLNHPFILNWQQIADDQPLPKKITYQPNEVPLSGILKAKYPQELIAFVRRMFHAVKVIDKKAKTAEVA